jgi:hypothetical protein
MKVCNKCNIEREVEEFRIRKLRGKDFRNGTCKKCEIAYTREYYKKNKKTLKFVVSVMYQAQIANSIKRGHNPPEYTQDELYQWVKKQKNLEELMKNWKNSGYRKNFKPSCDRIDDYKGYSFDNIRLVTTEFNIKRGHIDRKNGINNKINIKISQFTKDNILVKTYESSMIAFRETGINPSNIRQCARGLRKTAGGYIWKPYN